MRNQDSKTIGRTCLLAFLVLSCGSAALANAPAIRPSEPEPKPEAKAESIQEHMKIVPHENVESLEMIKLELPSSVVAELVEQMDEKDTEKKSDARDGAEARTLIAGASLAMALSLGGLALLSGKGSDRKKPMLIVAGGVMLLGALAATSVADIALPPELIEEARKREEQPNQGVLEQQGLIPIQLIVSTDENAQKPRLHITTDQFENLKRAYRNENAKLKAAKTDIDKNKE